jgi:hypothetical protein
MLAQMNTRDYKMPEQRAGLPPHIKTILVTGAGGELSTLRLLGTSSDSVGFVGQQLSRVLLDLHPNVKILATDIVLPPTLDQDEKRYKAVKADLGDIKQVESLFEGEEVGGVFALQYVAFLPESPFSLCKPIPPSISYPPRPLHCPLHLSHLPLYPIPLALLSASLYTETSPPLPTCPRLSPAPELPMTPADDILAVSCQEAARRTSN